MIKPITFCIPTSNNEKDYTILLLESLKNNTQIENHEILIFVDSDNQNTYDTLIEKKHTFPNMKIYRNETGYPFGSQRNVSVMFDAAKNDIVCYLQSDMVVGKDLDVHIGNDLSDVNTVLSFTRIEPPLHPPSPEKIVENIGITPEEFNFDKFNRIVKDIQNEDKTIINDVYFAPFALFKKTWFDVIGGFDTQFRCSREDSDFAVRCKLNDIKLIQSWKTIVYHFTCVSSRGKDWYKNDDDSKYKNELQKNADIQEVFRFIRKWGRFGHKIDFVYEIGCFIEMDSFVDLNFVLSIEPYVSRLYFNDKSVVDYLIHTLEFNSNYYSNLRWKYSKDYWDSVSHKFNPTDFKNKILFSDGTDIKDDIVMYCKHSNLVKSFDSYSKVFFNIQEMIHDANIGVYEYEGIRFQINEKNNTINNLKYMNTNWNYLIKDPICIFT
jgi:GT2 family glycosyltransferase